MINLQLSAAFVAWAATTFLAHFSVKQILTTVAPVGFEAVLLCLLLTTLQMAAGAVLTLPATFSGFHVPNRDYFGLPLVLAALHALAAFLTNYSMSQVTASLTHLVKMTEPLCTALIATLLGQTKPSLRLAVVLTVAVVTAMGSEPGLIHTTSLSGVAIALLSNLCYAFRNTGMKQLCKNKLTLRDFSQLSNGGFVILGISWLVLGGLSSQGLELVYKLINLSRTSHLFLAAAGLFHPIYNIISLTVILSMFSPIQHALLNVAKRVTVVLGFLIFTYSTSTGVSMTNVISGCLCISVIMWGNRVKEETQDTWRMPPSRWLIRGGILFLLIFPLLIISHSFSPFNLALTISLPFSSYLPGLALVPTASLPFTALWTHHQPLSPAASLRLSSLSSSGLPATLLCTSTPCLSSASSLGLPAHSLVLPPLCQDTPLQPFVLHHVFYKVVLEQHFHTVLQLVTGICYLYKNTARLINPNMDLDFHGLLGKPTSSILPHLIFSQNGEVVFGSSPIIHSKELQVLMEEVMASLDPLPNPVSSQILPVRGVSGLLSLASLSRNFTLLTASTDALPAAKEDTGAIHYFAFTQKYHAKGQCKGGCATNAGNEMQSLSSIQYIPEITSWVDETRMANHSARLPHSTTLVIPNAWWGPAWPWKDWSLPLAPSLHPVVVSIHINSWNGVMVPPGQSTLDKLQQWGPLGARDKGAFRSLQKHNVSSFFSGCLTLTLDPRLRAAQPSQVLLVDTINNQYVKNNLLPNASKADIVSYSHTLEAPFPPRFHHSFQYAYGSLLQIAKSKLVITSRIHVALPAVALGTPVVFVVSGKDPHNTGLPGGGGGRTEGLTDLFHIAQLNFTDKSWTFNPDFDWENPPVNPNRTLHQRLVARLWSRLRQEPVLADSARLFGLMPRARPPGPGGPRVVILVLRGLADLVSLRSVESCLFHHSGAEVTVVLQGGGEELGQHLATLQEVGYNINMTTQLEPGLPSPDWQIDSSTILTREVAGKEGKGAPVATVACKEAEAAAGALVTAVRIALTLEEIRKLPKKSFCRRILNEFSILTNIIV